MRNIALLIGVWVYATAASAQSAQQFDLICDVRNLQTGLPSSQFHAQVDLTTMRWCEAPCSTPKTLQAARHLLLLTVSAEGQAGHYIITRRSVDRTTGAYQFRQTQGRRVLADHAGICRAAPYQSRPARLF